MKMIEVYIAGELNKQDGSSRYGFVIIQDGKELHRITGPIEEHSTSIHESEYRAVKLLSEASEKSKESM